MFGLDWIPANGYLPYAVGIVAALIAFGIASVMISWLMARPSTQSDSSHIVQLEAIDWDKPSMGVGDRRNSIRRDGTTVVVFITSPAYGGQMHNGWVLDRSTGGLRIAVKEPLPPGSTIQVKTQNAPDTIPWSVLTVRSCKVVNGHHELGCSFDETPPWNILLLFG